MAMGIDQHARGPRVSVAWLLRRALERVNKETESFAARSDTAAGRRLDDPGLRPEFLVVMIPSGAGMHLQIVRPPIASIGCRVSAGLAAFDDWRSGLEPRLADSEGLLTLSHHLDVGDPLPNLKLEDQHARLHVLANTVKGKAVVLLFYPSSRFPACQQMLRSFLGVFPQLGELAHVFAVTNDPPEANASAAGIDSVPFPLFSDRDRNFARSFALQHNIEEPQDFMGAGAFSAIVAGPDLRVLKIDRDMGDANQATDIVKFLSETLAIKPLVLPRAAPVLRVQRALDPAFCRRLIESFETGESVTTGTLRDAAGGGLEEHKDSSVKLRRDHFVRDPDLKNDLRALIGRRVIPEIFKAFDYKVTRFDDFKVGCYDSESGGYFRVHRDNNIISGAHRRFAMSLNLNTDEYEGGNLCFPEFGPHLYRPDSGEALILSCSLLHEATPVTAGRRFVLLSFFFGDADQEMLALRTVGQR